MSSPELPAAPPRVTLLTDFGPKDTYVGIMKGVIATIAPQAVVEDLSHGVRPQDVAEAAFLLASAYRYFPPGTIHVAVVDPGVGSARAILAMEFGGFRFVAPDNGLLGGVLRGRAPTRMVRVEEARYFLQPVSATFHGRDILAPVAAHLAAGVSVDQLGPPHDAHCPAPWPAPRQTQKGWEGEIIHVDHFGNCVTNFVPGERAPHGVVVLPGDRRVAVHGHYAAVASGEALAVVGSSGYLELAVRDGSAESLPGLGRGARLTWVPDLADPRLEGA